VIGVSKNNDRKKFVSSFVNINPGDFLMLQLFRPAIVVFKNLLKITQQSFSRWGGLNYKTQLK